MKKKLLAVAVLLGFLLGCGGGLEPGEPVEFSQLVTGDKDGELEISDRARELEGKKVEMSGFMTPLTPLGADFFYMIEVPGAVCPYCAGEDVDFHNVIQVYSPPDERVRFTYDPLKVTGELEVGKEIDEEGEKSYFRIRAREVEKGE